MYSIEEISNKPHLWKNVNDSLNYLLVICLILWLTNILWRRRKLYIYSYKIPGPFCLPVIGCTYLFLGDTSDIMGTLVKIQDAYADLAKIWFGPKLIYLVSKPEHMEKVLTSPECINKDYLYRFLSYVIGTGLMTAPDKKWRKHRKVLAPSFNQKILDTFMEVFADQSVVLEEQLQKYVEKRNIDMFTILSTCTLDIICETAMGVKMNAQKTDSAFAKHLDKLMEITALRIFHPWLHVDSLFEYFPLGREYRKSIKYYRDFCVSVIRKKTAEHQQRLEDERNGLRVDTEERRPKKIKAFLDLILENSNFTEEELREEVDIFIIAGTDTTASSLTFFFTCMGIFQDIQEKVYEEIIGIIGYDRKVEPADLPHMKYTERVIKETLRVFPVAAFFLREIGEDLDLGDAILPKGSTAFFGPVHIHRNPNYWEEPLKFDPDRFLPENIAKRHPCTYVPFSLGTRNCIGARYAMMSMKTILATVIRRYKFTSEYKTIEEIKLKTNVVLRLKDGPKLTIQNR